MRNKYPGYCYRCGRLVEKAAGHFERVRGGWRVIHTECVFLQREEKGLISTGHRAKLNPDGTFVKPQPTMTQTEFRARLAERKDEN